MHVSSPGYSQMYLNIKIKFSKTQHSQELEWDHQYESFVVIPLETILSVLKTVTWEIIVNSVRAPCWCSNFSGACVVSVV
jgi:hypothetical protein